MLYDVKITYDGTSFNGIPIDKPANSSTFYF